jgi:leucyl aminopeptidase
MRILALQLCVGAALTIGLVSVVATRDKPRAWITIGDAALERARTVAAEIVPLESALVEADGIRERIHAVEVNEADVATIAGAVHQQLGRCGGFMYHLTEAEARSALRRRPNVGVRPAYLINNPELVIPVLASMHERHIETTIVTLSGFANRYYMSQGGVDASHWLMQNWTAIAAGRPDITVEQFVHSGYRQPSVVLTIAGSDKASQAIVMGAHLDSILVSKMSETAVAPGADDDASGMASLTEALRAMVENGYKPRRTIYMLAYAAEEVGLRGSQEIARSFKEKKMDVVGVLQLDMTNYKGSANDIYLLTDYTDSQQNDFLAQLLRAYLPDLKVGYDKCGYACSDHASWSAQGYAASMPFESSLSRRNPYIHSTKDTFASSGNQAGHALKFARLAAAYAVELGSD